MITKVCGIYFSATGNTKKITETVAAQLAKDLGCPMELKDFTAPAARTEVKEFPADTLVVAGSPTYAGKLPNKILPDFQTKLKGNGTPAVAVVTFGNRSFDNSLAELVSVLTAGGFRPVGGFLGSPGRRTSLCGGPGSGRGLRGSRGCPGGEGGASCAFRCGRCCRPLLCPEGHGRSAGQVPEGEAPDRYGEVHEMRKVRPALSGGLHRPAGRFQRPRHLHQVSGLCPRMSGACEVLR